MELTEQVAALVKQNEELKAAIATVRIAIAALHVADGLEAVAGTAKPKAKRGRKAKAASGKSTRGRKSKFDDETASKMAAAKKAGATWKDLASEYKASIPTLMRTVARVNGVHA